MIKINSVIIPTPSDYSVSVNDISKAERMASGIIKIDIIATKRKIELSYRYLSQVDLASILQSFQIGTGTSAQYSFFTVEYPDPVTGALRTGTFYVGDRSAGAIDYQNNTMRWKDIKFNLIEQ